MDYRSGDQESLKCCPGCGAVVDTFSYWDIRDNLRRAEKIIVELRRELEDLKCRQFSEPATK